MLDFPQLSPPEEIYHFLTLQCSSTCEPRACIRWSSAPSAHPELYSLYAELQDMAPPEGKKARKTPAKGVKKKSTKKQDAKKAAGREGMRHNSCHFTGGAFLVIKAAGCCQILMQIVK